MNMRVLQHMHVSMYVCEYYDILLCEERGTNEWKGEKHRESGECEQYEMYSMAQYHTCIIQTANPIQ